MIAEISIKKLSAKEFFKRNTAEIVNLFMTKIGGVKKDDLVEYIKNYSIVAQAHNLELPAKPEERVSVKLMELLYVSLTKY